MKFLAQSAVGPGVDPAGVVSNLSADDVHAILNRLASWIFTAFMVVAIIAIIFAAFQYASSGGKAENIRTATRAIIYAIIAIVIALLSGGISNLIADILKP